MFTRYIFICFSFLLILLSCQNTSPKKQTLTKEQKDSLIILKTGATLPHPRGTIETIYLIHRAEPNFAPEFLFNTDSLVSAREEELIACLYTNLCFHIFYKNLTPELMDKYYHHLSYKNHSFLTQADEFAFKKAMQHKDSALYFIATKKIEYAVDFSTDERVNYYQAGFFSTLYYSISVARKTNYTNNELLERILDKRIDAKYILNKTKPCSSKDTIALQQFLSCVNSIHNTEIKHSDTTYSNLYEINSYNFDKRHIPYWDSIYEISVRKRAELYGNQ